MNMYQFLAEMIASAPTPCADCNAEQDVLDLGGGLHTLTIRHDDTCPTWRGMNGRTAA